MTLRIGIDLDNTILIYSELLQRLALAEGWIGEACPAEKQAIKRGLIEVAGDAARGEHRWQRLQSWIYGTRIDEAALADGFVDFLETARHRGAELWIVSHKSTTSHFDPSVNLRAHAMATLETRGFFDKLGLNRDRIFFEDTRAAKLQRISDLALTHFIDDLPEVLSDRAFPRTTQPLLYGALPGSEGLPAFPDWSEIAFYLRHADLFGVDHRLTDWRLAGRGGNNTLIQFGFHASPSLVVKRYLVDPEDPRPRKQHEWRFLRFLWERGVHHVPRPVSELEDGLVLSHITGHTPEAGPDAVAALNTMLVQLEQAARQPGETSIGPAVDSRFRLRDFVDDLLARWQRTLGHARERPEFAHIARFLEAVLAPRKTAALDRFEAVCHEYDLDPTRELERGQWLASPSDFGLHNMLVDRKGGYHFVDFEYAGWDDPVKLLCDFLHHAGNAMPRDQRLAVIHHLIGRRDDGPHLRARLLAVGDLVALEWTLIVLNVVTPFILRRKRFADPQTDVAGLVARRCERALAMHRAFVPIQNLLGA